MATIEVAVSTDLTPQHAWALASDLRRGLLGTRVGRLVAHLAALR